MAKRDVQKSLRRKAAEKRMEKKHEDKMAKQRAESAALEKEVARQSEEAWKLELSLKDKEFWRMKDCIKYDLAPGDDIDVEEFDDDDDDDQY
jgi:hypothetical protein